MTEADNPAAGVVECRQIAETCRDSGQELTVLAPVVRPGDTVLRGSFRLERLRSGLSLHATDATDLFDLTTQVVREPGLTVSIFLSGTADISLGRAGFRLGRSDGGASHAFALACAEPDLFVRRGSRGGRVRKVGITVPPEWLDSLPDSGGEAIRRFACRHGATETWEPSATHRHLAEQILAPSPYCPLLSSLHRETHALAIATDALAVLAGLPERNHGGGLGARDRARLRAVRDYLESDADADIHLDTLARHAGMSVSALQRLFRTAHGMSVFEYVRRQRLDQARHRLEADRISVTEAAFEAGYGSPANFATAFKRRFGLSPSQVGGRKV